MDYVPGWHEEDFGPSFTREDVETALAQRPDMARFLLDLLMSDVHSTLGWPHAEAKNFVLDTAAVILDFIEDDEWTFVDRVIGNVQQRMHDEFIHTSWPECPAHGRHPLWLASEQPWRWVCTGVSIPLGELHAPA